MVMPNFTSPEEANEFLIAQFEEIIQKIESVKTHEEKANIMREFDMTQFRAEEQMLGDKQVKNYAEYQKAKPLVYDFFAWVEKERGIEVFKESTKNPFFNEMVNNKMMSIAMMIQLLPMIPVELQAYFSLNIFRTTYELNLKNLTIILHETLKKQNKKTAKFYDIKSLRDEFDEYPRIEELMNYFRNDIRNPIAHEDWFVKNGWVWTRNKDQEQKQDMLEVSKQIYELFYFRVALSTYMLDSYKSYAKNIQVTPKQVEDFVKSIKLKIKELKNAQNAK